jgi:hypothetical protein
MSTHLHGQVNRRIRNTVLHVIREQDLNRLAPQLRLGVPHILRHIGLALPVEDVGELALRQRFAIWQRSPDKVLQLGHVLSSVDDPLALLCFNLGGHALPEVGHGVDDVSSGESILQAFGVVEISLDQFNALLCQLLCLGGGGVSGQAADVVSLGFFEELADDRTALD